MSLSKQKQTRGYNRDSFYKCKKIAGQEKGKQNPRAKAYGTSAEQDSQICTAHNGYLRYVSV